MKLHGATKLWDFELDRVEQDARSVLTRLSYRDAAYKPLCEAFLKELACFVLNEKLAQWSRNEELIKGYIAERTVARDRMRQLGRQIAAVHYAYRKQCAERKRALQESLLRAQVLAVQPVQSKGWRNVANRHKGVR